MTSGHPTHHPTSGDDLHTTAQQSLFADGAQVRHDAPDTSVEAAKRVMLRSGTQRYKVLHAIAFAGRHGITDEEILAATGLSPNTIRPRRVELVNAGLVVATADGDAAPRRPACRGAPVTAELYLKRKAKRDGRGHDRRRRHHRQPQRRPLTRPRKSRVATRHARPAAASTCRCGSTSGPR